MTWGSSLYGGDSASVSTSLVNVVKIVPNHVAFAAIRLDGTVITWGNASGGGDLLLVSSRLIDVISISSTSVSFAALKSDNTIVCWGNVDNGADCGSISNNNIEFVTTLDTTNVDFSMTIVPTGSPSSSPSGIPSGVPTTSQPSTQPSSTPSGVPSSGPSAPSFIPSSAPTGPTSMPTLPVQALSNSHKNSLSAGILSLVIIVSFVLIVLVLGIIYYCNNMKYKEVEKREQDFQHKYSITNIIEKGDVAMSNTSKASMKMNDIYGESSATKLAYHNKHLAMESNAMLHGGEGGQSVAGQEIAAGTAGTSLVSRSPTPSSSSPSRSPSASPKSNKKHLAIVPRAGVGGGARGLKVENGRANSPARSRSPKPPGK